MSTNNVVGLTGGIGAGKSTAASILGDFGAIIVDCDQLGRDVVKPSGTAYMDIVNHFGPDIVHDDGTLDRQQLASVVFSDPAELAALNAITHPAMDLEIAAAISTAQPTDVVVLDMAILAESQLGAGQYNHVLVVETAMDLRIDRLISIRAMSPDDAKARIASQASDQQRREIADETITNNSGVEELRNALRAWWDRYQIDITP